jgi:hypothetical protein
MKAIVLPDDVLKPLEKRFGPAVRQMGSWNSDGTFGYESVSMAAVKKAAEALEDPDLLRALFHLDCTADQTRPFLDLLETFGPALIDKIAAAYRERTFS